MQTYSIKIFGRIFKNNEKFQSHFDRPAVSLPNLTDENDKTEERKRRASDSNTTSATSTLKSGNYRKRSSRSASNPWDETPLVREPAYEDAKKLRESLIRSTPDLSLHHLHETALMNRKNTFGSLGTELDSEMEEDSRV